MTADRDHDPVPTGDLDVDELMRQVRREVKSRGAALSSPAPKDPSDDSAARSPTSPNTGHFEIKGEYDLVDFLALEDEAFLRAAYQGILHREPDEGGRGHFLDLLRSGAVSKVEVLGRLGYSQEGRSKRVLVRGLRRRFALETAFRLPLVGQILALGRYLLKRPRVAAKLDAMEVRAARKQLEARRSLEASARDLRDKGDGVEVQRDLDALAESLQSRADAAAVRRHLASLSQRLQRRTDAVDLLRKADAAEFRRQLTERKYEILAQQRQISVLLKAVEEGRAKRSDDQAVVASARESDRWLDGFYTSFENAFRGTREEIKRRSEPYLSFVRSAGAGSKTSAVLDLGCGRGEWLQLLREQGLAGKGLDTNRVTIEQCREAGLDVVEGDAMEYLRGLPDACLG
ncbi:MAG: methionine biosynthesis protein MetW, partial [Pseudomonadota bacterium]|nr:methionine biosynthesis protein MetW [Pseudomonadota bacterium]